MIIFHQQAAVTREDIGERVGVIALPRRLDAHRDREDRLLGGVGERAVVGRVLHDSRCGEKGRRVVRRRDCFRHDSPIRFVRPR